jgi:glycosyltransferase involved in cell wall biosynthesis
MKILFIHNAFFPHDIGGAESSLLDRCESLIKKGNDVEVLTVNPVKQKESINSYTYNGIPVYSMSLPWSSCSPYNSERSTIKKVFWHIIPILFFWRGFLQFYKFVNAKKFDKIVYINMPGVPLLHYWNFMRIDKYFIVADYNYVCINGSMFKDDKVCDKQCLKCNIFSKIKTEPLKKSSGVVYISEYMKGCYSKLGVRVNDTVIYNGQKFHGNNFCVSSESSNVFKLGFIGQIKPNKGVEIFISEVNILCGLLEGSGIKLRIIIAGSCSNEKIIDLKKASPLVELEFLGRVDKDFFYESIDVVVVPSKWREPLGRIAFEAAAFGKIAFVSNSGGLPETVPNDYYTFDVSKRGELADRLYHYVMLNPKDADFKVGEFIKFSKNKFSTDISADSYVGFLNGS